MYQVYSISTPDGKYRYYGTSSNLTKRLYTHKSRFNQTTYGSNYPVYVMLRTKVDSFDECKVKVFASYKNKHDALRTEQRLISACGNLNSKRAIA